MKTLGMIGPDLTLLQDGVDLRLRHHGGAEICIPSGEVARAVAMMASAHADTLCGEVGRNEHCTGADAVWCPNHGHCTCPDADPWPPILSTCPLHGEASGHATE